MRFTSAIGPTGLFGGGGPADPVREFPVKVRVVVDLVRKGGPSVPNADGTGVYGTGGGGGSHNSAGKPGGNGIIILRYQV